MKPVSGAVALVLLSLLCSLPIKGAAQTSEIPPEQFKSLAKDLSRLQELVLEAQSRQQAEVLGPWFAGGYAPTVEVTNKFAFAKVGADVKADNIFSPAMGTKLRVIDKLEGWYAVKFPQAERGYQSGWIKASDVVPVVSPTMQTAKPRPATGLGEAIYEELTEAAAQMREKYAQNPYFRITGFSVNVGIPPSVSIAFEFKQK